MLSTSFLITNTVLVSILVFSCRGEKGESPLSETQKAQTVTKIQTKNIVPTEIEVKKTPHIDRTRLTKTLSPLTLLKNKVENNPNININDMSTTNEESPALRESQFIIKKAHEALAELNKIKTERQSGYQYIEINISLHQLIEMGSLNLSYLLKNKSPLIISLTEFIKSRSPSEISEETNALLRSKLLTLPILAYLTYNVSSHPSSWRVIDDNLSYINATKITLSELINEKIDINTGFMRLFSRQYSSTNISLASKSILESEKNLRLPLLQEVHSHILQAFQTYQLSETSEQEKKSSIFIDLQKIHDSTIQLSNAPALATSTKKHLKTSIEFIGPKIYTILVHPNKHHEIKKVVDSFLTSTSETLTSLNID